MHQNQGIKIQKYNIESLNQKSTRTFYKNLNP